MDVDLKNRLLREASWLEHSMSERAEWSNDKERLKAIASLLYQIGDAMVHNESEDAKVCSNCASFKDGRCMEYVDISIRYPDEESCQYFIRKSAGKLKVSYSGFLNN